jgi:hypothetical protein
MVTLGQSLVSQVLTNFLSFGPNFGQASADGLWEGIWGQILVRQGLTLT